MKATKVKKSYKEVIETIEKLEQGFFKLDYITNFDSRIPPVYKTLENNINPKQNLDSEWSKRMY